MTANLLSKLNWRYATKVFDPNKKIPEQKFNDILETLRLSASSFGLQPWKFVVVNDPKLRQELLPHSWNQRQVIDASHLIVLSRPKDITEIDVNKYVQSMIKERGVPAEALEGYRKMMVGFCQGMSPEQRKEWMKNQIYIALGNLLTCCAILDIDSCPMEGFSPKKYDEILGLDRFGLESVVVCPVGYRSADDKYASLKKVRYPLNDLIIKL